MKSKIDMSSIIEAMKSPFKTEDSLSLKSKSISIREKDPEKFIKRITPQIKEVYNQGLKYQTPEEWDESFYILGGGQSRRTSTAILERMSWEQFLEKFQEIISKSLD